MFSILFSAVWVFFLTGQVRASGTVACLCFLQYQNFAGKVAVFVKIMHSTSHIETIPSQKWLDNGECR